MLGNFFSIRKRQLFVHCQYLTMWMLEKGSSRKKHLVRVNLEMRAIVFQPWKFYFRTEAPKMRVTSFYFLCIHNNQSKLWLPFCNIRSLYQTFNLGSIIVHTNSAVYHLCIFSRVCRPHNGKRCEGNHKEYLICNPQVRLKRNNSDFKVSWRHTIPPLR